MNPGDVEIISARDTMHELPVLVFEGMEYRVSYQLNDWVCLTWIVSVLLSAPIVPGN